jgi:hypothetical protein
MVRVVEPEILDRLPSADEAAAHSRRDLARLNVLMRHACLIRQHLTMDVTRIADLGAGDGTLLLNALKSANSNVREVVLVDQQRIVTDTTLAAFESLGINPTVASADVFDWLARQSTAAHTAIVANLFLHHFQRENLQRLLDLASQVSDLFIACEPRRALWPQLAASLVGLIGCNHVTRHDAVVSVRAGFRDRELSALWPDPSRWRIEERHPGLFSHLFVARRR